MVAAGTFAAAGWFILPFAIPLPRPLLAEQKSSPVLIDRHGRILQHFASLDGTRAAPVFASALPADLVACTLAAEDKRFRSHDGIDFLATARALKNGIRHRHFHSGASTITQQLIKISRPPASRDVPTKIREALGARRLEMTWSKEQILTEYLNRLDYGNHRIGAAEAARFYFQKSLSDLSLAESALLSGLPQGPSRLNPLRHPDRAVKRRNRILDRLAAMGDVPDHRIVAAKAEPLVLRPLRKRSIAPWLAGAMRNLNRQRIVTTIDGALQQHVESIVSEEVARLRSANLRHAAVVVIHNPTREILALVSSADWNDARGGQINGALAPRSPGSTLKPFTYLLALGTNQRIPASIIADIPTPFRTPEGLDLPENYDRQYRGPVTLRNALACSLNIPAMRELNALGGPEPLHQLLTFYGIDTLGATPSQHGLGLTIGNAPIRLLDLTNAYATLASLGTHLPPTLTRRLRPKPVRHPALPQDSFLLIADILSDALARAPAFPPGGPLDLPFRCAVKTGTSSDFRDNWCIGFTPDFTVGVWAGNFENQPMKHLSGISGAAPIFHRVMVRAHRDTSPKWFPESKSLVQVSIDRRNGKSVPAALGNPHIVRDLAPAATLPPVALSADYTEDGRAVLDASYASWFASSHNNRRHELALAPQPADPDKEPLRVIVPAQGSTLLLDPDIPSGSDQMRPVTNLPGTARWSSATLRIEPALPEPIIHLIPGTHTVTATDPRTGHRQEITLHVKSL